MNTRKIVTLILDRLTMAELTADARSQVCLELEKRTVNLIHENKLLQNQADRQGKEHEAAIGQLNEQLASQSSLIDHLNNGITGLCADTRTPVDQALTQVNDTFLRQLRDDLDALAEWKLGTQGRQKMSEILRRMTAHGYPRKSDQPADPQDLPKEQP